jgi:YVTN family beta-propeller protein
MTRGGRRPLAYTTRLFGFAAITAALAVGVLGAPTATASASDPPALLFAPSFANNVVSVYNLSNDRLVASIGVDAHGACCAYATPDHKYVFIVDGLGPYATRINVATLEADHLTTLDGALGDRGAPVQSDSKTFWLDTLPQGNVQGIDVATGDIVNTFSSIGDAFSVSHSGSYLFEANDAQGVGGSALFPGALVVRSTTSGAVVGSVSLPLLDGLGQIPLAVFVSPDDQQVYVETVNALAPSLLYVINVANPTQPQYVKTLTLGDTALIGSFTPDGSQLWLPNAGSGTISVIDTADDTVVHTIDVGPFVSNVVFNGGTAYIAESNTALPDNSLTGLLLTLEGPVPGAAITPGTGSDTTIPLVDLMPGEVVQYNTSTYQPLNKPPLVLPSLSYVMDVVPSG